MKRDAVELKDIQVGSDSVSFKIGYQDPNMKSILKNLRKGLYPYFGKWRFVISKQPECREDGRTLFLKGRDRSKNSNQIHCPKDLWDSLLESLKILNEEMDPKSLQHEFFGRKI